MRKLLLLALATAPLAGCIAEPSPYYGGGAPYYGTAAAPAYVGIGVSGGYYPYYGSNHIRSNYNNDYWHYRNHGGGFHGGSGHAWGGHNGGGHSGGGHH